MPGTTVALLSNASHSNHADFAQVYYCNVCKKAISLSPNQTVQSIAQEVQLHSQKCMLSKGYPELNAEPITDRNLAPVFALQPRRTWSAEDERRKRLEDDPDAYDVGPHSVTCAGCHRPIRLNATGRYYAANWNKHKMGCKTASSVSGWGAVNAESRFTGRVAAFRVTKPSENTDMLTHSPSSGAADVRPSYSPQGHALEAYMGPSANSGAQRSAYDTRVSERQAGYPLNHVGSQCPSEDLKPPYPSSSSHQVEEAGSPPAGSSHNRYEVAPSDPSSSRKQVRPAFSTTPLPRLVQRDSMYAETRLHDSQKSIHALAAALRRSRSDFSQASGAPGSALEPGFLPPPLQASPGQPESSPISSASDKGKERQMEADASLRSSTHTFHAQYRYTYPSISPHDSPLQGRQSPFSNRSPSVSPNDRLNSTYSREGGSSRYHDHRDSRNRFSPDTGSATTSSSASSGFSPRSAMSSTFSPGYASQPDDARTLPSLSSLSLARNDKTSFRTPTIGRSGDLNAYSTTTTVSLPPLGVRDSESIVLPPIRDIATASVARDSPPASKRRLSEGEIYDKEDSADHYRPSLPRLNTQPGRRPDIDASGSRYTFSRDKSSPIYTPSHSKALPHRPTDPTLLQVSAIRSISATTSGSSDLYPSPRELSPASSDADAGGGSAGRLHPVWKWEQTRDSPNPSQRTARDDYDNDVDMDG